MMKKVRKCDFPTKKFSCDNICYSILKNINAQRSGNWVECGFSNETDFTDFLNALEEKGLIKRKTKPYSDSFDLSNYIYIGNEFLSFNKKQKFLRWLSNNVINLISCSLTFLNFLNK